MTPRVAITQPYVPGYRVPLWSRTIELLAADGIEARVFFGGDSEQLAIRERRGDGAEAEWAQQVATRTLKLSSRLPKVMYRRLPRGWRTALLVTEMQVSNGNAWAALVRRQPYVTLGHGKEYTSHEGRLSAWLESVLNSGARHALTYTGGGRAAVIARSRLSPEQVTAFNNSTDTQSLRAALDGTDAEAVAEFCRKSGIPSTAKVALFIGALNEHKRIDLLVDAALLVLHEESDWWLVVAGDGPESGAIQRLAERTGRVTFLGQASAAIYAPAARRASVLLNPGRIGLVAVDALVMGLPVLTTSSARHAPEAEYLTEGTNVFTTAPSAADFADLWRSSGAIAFGAVASDAASYVPTIDAAAEAIASAISAVVRERDTR